MNTSANKPVKFASDEQLKRVHQKNREQTIRQINESLKTREQMAREIDEFMADKDSHVAVAHRDLMRRGRVYTLLFFLIVVACTAFLLSM